MRIIFLDIDDVLNIHWKPIWDRQAVNNLNDIIQKTHSKLVITSTWRYKYSLDKLREIFKNQGVIGEVIDVLPDLQEDRGVEINIWLELNQELNITNWVVIDDKVFDILKHISDSQRIFCVQINKGLRDVRIKNKITDYLLYN